MTVTNGLAKAATFEDDVAFLKKHVEVVVLGGEGDARVAVVPAYQGRVMTSTANGAEGLSYGWINRALISSGETVPHINVFGGEDRFWLGPEGGQFSIFFEGGSPFDLEHWQTPALIDTDTFETVSSDEASAAFKKSASLTNFSGTKFDIQIDRTIRLLDAAAVKEHFGLDLPADVQAVAFESDNQLTNTGDKAWDKETGLLSIWILGMFNPSPETTIVVPYETGTVEDLGPVVNDTYFGKVPGERLVAKDGVIYFSGDGKYRSKIGLSPHRAKPVVGSFDAANNVLTLVQFTKPTDATDYVNSMWEMQDAPYAGDVVNSYNDGPPEPGKAPLGPFYELETSSPALALKPGEVGAHSHRTLHLQGTREELNIIAKETLGVGLKEIEGALK